MKKILASIFILIMGTIAFFWLRPSPEIISYKEKKVSRGSIEVLISSTGTIQPENRLEIKAPIAGRIEEILRREGEIVKRGDILAWMSSTERAALLDAARSKGASELKYWEELYRPTAVVSPIDGTIILRNVEAGQTFTNADAIYVLSNRLTVKAQVDETDIAAVKVGQNANIILDAYSREKIKGTVTAIAYDSTAVNNITTYDVDVTPIEAPDFMRSGMTATINFIIEKKEDILLINNSSIVEEANEFGVYTPLSDGKREFRALELGISDGRVTEVISGLKEGESILVIDMSQMNKSESSNPLNSRPRRR